MKKKMIRAVAFGNLIVLALSLFLYAAEAMKPLFDAAYGFSMKGAMTHQPHEDIVVVGIDAESIREFGSYPFDRKIYAQAVKTMQEAGAKVIAFDVTFENPSNPESDAALAAQLAGYSNIIVPATANLENEFRRTTTVQKNSMIMANSVTKPIPAIAAASQQAHINRTIDKDGAIRRTWLMIDTPEDGPLPALGYKAAELAGAEVGSYLRYPSLPNRPLHEMLIDFHAATNDFNYVSLHRVVKGGLPADLFRDRIIFIGFTGPGTDEGTTPVENHMNLVYAHANITSQLMNGSYIRPADNLTTLAFIAAAIALMILLTWRFKPIVTVAALFVLGFASLAAQYALFAQQKLLLNTIDPLVALCLAFFVNMALKTYYETKQKNYITKQFGRYISPDLVKEIAKSDQEIQLGGIKRDLSILFLDIRGFTPLSEKLTPEEIVDFLNMMFNLITERTLENKGTVDKFIGDAAMLLFNAPLDVPHHPYYAVKTAVEIQQGMVKVREDVFAKYGVHISIGIGINSGEVVVGNIGSYLRIDYTAIGDNVNTAARIESNTQPNQILVSAETYRRTQPYFEYNCIGEIKVKGKEIPLTLYEALALVSAPEEEVQPATKARQTAPVG